MNRLAGGRTPERKEYSCRGHHTNFGSLSKQIKVAISLAKRREREARPEIASQKASLAASGKRKVWRNAID